MRENPPLTMLARVVADYVGASMGELIGRARPHNRPAATHEAAEPRIDAPPTIDDLGLAGAEWTPWSEDDEDGYLVARDNGYVVIRGNDPGTPIRVFDEDDWDAFTRGDTPEM